MGARRRANKMVRTASVVTLPRSFCPVTNLATVNLNKFTSTANADGSVTIVVAHRRPPDGNWLNVCGHAAGNMMFRWISAKKKIAPQTALVQLDSAYWPRMMRCWNS